MSQTAFKKYEVNEEPTDPSQITAGSFTDTGDGTVPGSGGLITIHYLKVGKLYFGFNAYLATSGQVNMVCGPSAGGPNPTSAGMNDTVARLCTKLGITENTRYIGYIYSSSPRVASWSPGGATWSQGNPNESCFVQGILAN